VFLVASAVSPVEYEASWAGMDSVGAALGTAVALEMVVCPEQVPVE